MHAIEVLRNPGCLASVAVFAVHGEDAFLRREILAAIHEAVFPGPDEDRSSARFPGAEARLADVFDELRTLPFFAKRRLVIVEEADPFVTAHRKELEHYVEHPAERGVLVLMLKSLPGNTRLAKIVDQHGLAIDCRGPSDRQILPWLAHLAKSRFQVPLETGAAELLVELAGSDVGVLVSELEKLAVYVGDRRKIHREDVARMVGAGRIETVWKTLDAATTGRPDLALELLDGLLAAGEHPVALLSAMSVSLLKVHHAGHLRRKKVGLREACQAAGIPPFAVELTRQQHAHLGPSRVDELPGLLLRADLDLKGSTQLSTRIVLEKFLIGLATPRTD